MQLGVLHRVGLQLSWFQDLWQHAWMQQDASSIHGNVLDFNLELGVCFCCDQTKLITLPVQGQGETVARSQSSRRSQGVILQWPTQVKGVCLNFFEGAFSCRIVSCVHTGCQVAVYGLVH